MSVPSHLNVGARRHRARKEIAAREARQLEGKRGVARRARATREAVATTKTSVTEIVSKKGHPMKILTSTTDISQRYVVYSRRYQVQ